MARKVTYDQDKVKELRMEVILASLAVLQDKDDAKKWSQYKRDLVLKYASRVLPTLVAGKDDSTDLIPVPLLGGNANVNKGNNSNQETPQAQEED